jgi:hypothetical protein
MPIIGSDSAGSAQQPNPALLCQPAPAATLKSPQLPVWLFDHPAGMAEMLTAVSL